MSFDESTLTHRAAPNVRAGQPSGKGRLPLWAKLFLIPLITGFGGTAVVLLSLRYAPLPDASLANPTEIDAADGTRLADWTLDGSRSDRVTLHDVPKALQQATIAVEDVNFYHHGAFNWPSLGRALLVNVTHGRVIQGGSTITQQLAKNLYLSQDRTIIRKLREALYALQLELHEPKPIILNQYLNVIYYGHGAYGVGAAAELYYNKPVQSLDVAESAMLAGLPKGPSIYSPLLHFRRAKGRQHLVLARMVRAGFLTQAQADAAYGETLHFATRHAVLKAAPYFTVTAIQEVEHRFHVSSEDLYAGNSSITTTLDPMLQQAAEHAISTTISRHSDIEVALVALDPHTGAIKAMVGGRNYELSPYNRSFAERQPGSTFKGILYTAALSHGWSPANEIDSAMTTFAYGRNADKYYTVHDYGDFYAHRPLTMREAIARSDNVYAVTTNVAVGPRTVVDMAHRMGVHSPLQPYPSLALGVFPTSPLQMATAYATLANGGYQIAPYTVVQFRDAKTRQVYQTDPLHKPTISPQVAFQMTDLLTSVMGNHGTAHSVQNYLRHPVAAKTGTTDTDAWMVGYTPNLVAAVWIGYDNNRKLSLSEAHLAAPVWAKFMGMAEVHAPSAWFSPPPGVIARTIDPLTGALATSACAVTERDYFQPGTEPLNTCPLHPVEHQDWQPMPRHSLWARIRHWLS